MGSVQSDCECPECHYKLAMEDYYYKSDEVYVMCGRCGYAYSRVAIIDQRKSDRLFAKINRLLAEGKWKAALEARGYTIHPEWDEKVARSLLSDKPQMIKTDYQGKFVYKERTNHGRGMWYMSDSNGGVTSVGVFKKGGQRSFVKDFKEKALNGEDAGYTFKRGGQWWIRSLKYNKVEPVEDNSYIVHGERLVEAVEEHNK